jgi:hypothetical protein
MLYCLQHARHNILNLPHTFKVGSTTEVNQTLLISFEAENVGAYT